MRQTVLITGTSSGFGRRAVDEFLAEGWNVAATLRDVSRWSGAQSDRLLVRALDVRDDASVVAAVDGVVERFGGLDVVVNNAGMGLFSVFATTPPGVVEELFDTNVFGPMRVIHAALPVFGRQGGGRVVNVTSASATFAGPFMAAYGASKAALHNFSEALGYELADLGVDVKVVEPGFVPSTDFVQQTRARLEGIAVPEEYLPYFGRVLATFDVPPPENYLATEREVARAVFDAATDTSGQARFRVGGDAVDYARARQRSDIEIDTWRRDYFLTT